MDAANGGGHARQRAADMRRDSRWRRFGPLLVLVILVGVGQMVRMWVTEEWARRIQAEDRGVEIAQAVFLGGAGLLCLVAMVCCRAGYWWWVGPAFICFFMCWREVEVDDRYLGEHAFSWKYLIEAATPLEERLLLGVPSVGLALLVLVTCLVNVRPLLRTLRRRDLRVGVHLFALGVGFYLLAQVYDRAWGWVKAYSFYLPGFGGHRDDFWEEWFELIGAVAILMGVFDNFRRRDTIAAAPPPDAPAAAEETPPP